MQSKNVCDYCTSEFVCDLCVEHSMFNGISVPEIIHCGECGNYVPLDIKDQFGRIVKKTGRGYCKDNSQRGDRKDGNWCGWSVRADEIDEAQMTVYDFCDGGEEDEID